MGGEGLAVDSGEPDEREKLGLFGDVCAECSCVR